MHWLRLAADLLFAAVRIFQAGVNRDEAIYDLAEAIPKFAAWPWPVGLEGRLLTLHYRGDAELFDACYRYARDCDATNQDPGTCILVRDMRSWFDERNRRLDREERELNERN
jgi:hypothetical protein